MNPAQAEKRPVLGIDVSGLDYDAAVDRILHAARTGMPLTVTALAVHGLMTGALDRHQRFRLNQLDVVCPDGQPVRWALNLLHGTRLPERVYGPELTVRLCRLAAREGLPVYFYGSRPEVLARMRSNLGRIAPGLRIAGMRPSLFRRSTATEQSSIVEEIKTSGASIVFVGLGCPRQEVWTFENGVRLGTPTIAVGAAFDFIAGTLPQAPAILQRHGLEWLFRLWHEPRRLWRRYLLLNPVFLLFLLLQLTGIPLFSDPGLPPSEPENFG
jgi:exopolysaccharide biosynthesis WecB/TagA/CpsF family protein